MQMSYVTSAVLKHIVRSLFLNFCLEMKSSFDGTCYNVHYILEFHVAQNSQYYVNFSE